MNTQHPITEVRMALLNIQNNLQYIEKKLDVLKLDEGVKTNIRQITSPYHAVLFDCQEELSVIGQEHGVITIDPLLNELTDNKTTTERATLIINTLHQHSTLLTECTDDLILRGATIKNDIEFASLVVLMTESVGNIQLLTQYVTKTLPTLTTNN